MPTKKNLTKQLENIEETQVSFSPQRNSFTADSGLANLEHPSLGEPPRFDIGREHILSKYWELANLDPEATKGNITGQLKALDSLCQELGLAKAAAQESDQRGDRQEIYRSAWMRPALRNTKGNTPTGNA